MKKPGIYFRSFLENPLKFDDEHKCLVIEAPGKAFLVNVLEFRPDGILYEIIENKKSRC